MPVNLHHCTRCGEPGAADNSFLVEIATHQREVSVWGTVHRACVLAGMPVRQYRADLIGKTFTVTMDHRWTCELVPAKVNRSDDWSPST